MTLLITLIVLIMVGGIAYLMLSSSKNVKTREDFLKELTKFVHGQQEPHQEYEDSFNIKFNFEGHDLIYEDIMVPGFKDQVNKAFLRMEIPGPLSLQFQEKIQSSKVVDSNMKLFKDVGATQEKTQLKVPEKFKMFTVDTNHIERTNKLFANSKFINILSNFKNMDSRGYHFMALKIVNGTMILTLYNERRYTPSLEIIKNNIYLFEDPIKDLINLYKILKQYS